MTVWLTSDTHYSHKNSMRYCGRPFFSVEACDQAMIDHWNALVKPEDLVIHMGDVAMHTAPMKRILPQLNGKKILIIGNHDLIYSYFLKTRGQKFIDKMYEEYKTVFDEIHESGKEFTFGVEGHGSQVVRLCHFPTKNTEDKYHNNKHDAARPLDTGILNICGHVHQNWLKRGNNINVGVDVWEFSPVSLETVVSLWDTGPTNIDNPKKLRTFLWTEYHTLVWRLNKLLNLFKSKK